MKELMNKKELEWRIYQHWRSEIHEHYLRNRKIQTTRNDYDKDSCNVDILAYLLVTPHMLASGSPSELPWCSQSRIIITTP